MDITKDRDITAVDDKLIEVSIRCILWERLHVATNT